MMFRRIANDVNVATDGRQRPETYVSLVDNLNQNDRVAWEQVGRSRTIPARFGISWRITHHLIIRSKPVIAWMRCTAPWRRPRSALCKRPKTNAAKPKRPSRRQPSNSRPRKPAKPIGRRSMRSGARDQNGLKSFIDGNSCDEAKQAAQKRLATLQDTLAAEAEACHRDADAFAALGPRDLAGVKALNQKTTCADVKAAAQGKIAAIEAEINAERETCKREDTDLKAFTKAGNRVEIDNLRQHGQCPATAAAAEQAMRDVIAAAEAETCKRRRPS